MRKEAEGHKLTAGVMMQSMETLGCLEKKPSGQKSTTQP
jgi:hypothetical protein